MGTVYQVLPPELAQFPATAFPQMVKNAGSNFPVFGLAFDAAAIEYAYWHTRAINYGSGNLTLKLMWYADTDTSTGTSHECMWGAAVAAITPNSDTGTNVETKAFGTAATAYTANGGTQVLMSTTITISSLDSIAAGDEIWLRVYRNATDGTNDDMTGDAILVGLELSYSDT